jgi:hypothetical protein
MYYSDVVIEYVATSFSPTRTDLAFKPLTNTTLTQNKTTMCVVVTNKKISLPKRSLCVFSNNKNTWFTEITFMVNMENNDDWLASNKTWKKWTRIGNGELLSYAGIDFQKPIDEE